MATVNKQRATSVHRAERDPQVYHPLDRLRGSIRRYIVIEGVLWAVLFVVLWFVLGLVLDYGVFKVARWDWVLDSWYAIRVLVLVATVLLFLGLLVWRFLRLAKEFSYASLALVLERRFPKLLGDRLITAVEMADVESMGKYGYSTEMIRATIAEARERVAKVPVNKVFNWGRLWKLGFLTVALLLGTVAASYAIYGVAAKTWSPVRFGWKFTHVAGIFFERNVALMNTPWPRQAHMELVGFPEGELTVGRDAPPPRIAARAYRWVIVDPADRSGWRPLRWSDLSPQFVGRTVPNLPPSLVAMEDPVTVDLVERMTYETDEGLSPEAAATREKIKKEMNFPEGPDPEKPGQTRGLPPTQDYEELQEVLKALAKKADEPSMGRTLRRLDVPSEVSYEYVGRRTAGNGVLPPQQNNEFAGEISGLKEDVDFVVRGADFSTVPKKIRLIPPPTLRRLGREQSEPAYLHHSPPQNEGYDSLKAQLQKVSAKDLSLTGDATVFAVPAGTELTLVAEAFKDDNGNVSDNDRITSAFAKPITGRFPGMVYKDGKPTEDPVKLEITNSGEGFRINFKSNQVAGQPYDKAKDFRLLDNVKFEVSFINKYDIVARRVVSIQVVQDQPPAVEVAVDTIRKIGNVYLVTPKARIPFNPDSFVRDDRGLSKVEYIFNYYTEDSDIVRAYRVKYAARSLLDVPLPGTMPSAILPRLHADNFRLLDKADDRLNSSVLVSEYLNQMNQLRRDPRGWFDESLGLAKVEELPPTLVEPLAKAFPQRRPGDKLFWIGDARNAKVFWSGSPQTQEVVRLANASDPQSIEKVAVPNTGRDSFLAALQERQLAAATDHIYWFSETQTVKKVELKDASRDYFDLKELHDRGIINLLPKEKDAQSIYRMDLNVQATDNNVDNEGGPRVVRNIDPIRLRIVSEIDLLVEIGKEEQQLADRLDEAIAKLTAARKKYDFVLSNNGFKEEVPAFVDAVKVRAQDALGDVEKSRDIVQTVVREMYRLYRECEINRVNESTLKQYKDRYEDLARVLSESPNAPNATFPKTQAVMNQVQNPLNSGRWAPLALVSDAQREIFVLEELLKDIRERIAQVQTKDKLKNDIIAIQQEQLRIKQQVTEWQKDIQGKFFLKHPTFGDVGVLTFSKGETKTISQSISWNKYDSDDIVAKVAVYDAANNLVADALTVPAELQLNYEKHQFRFEYQLKALSKEGTFKLRLTPAVGPPREFQVIVK